MPPGGRPRDRGWGGGAGRGRRAGIRVPSQRNPARPGERPGSKSKAQQGAGGWKTAIFVLREKKQIQMPSQWGFGGSQEKAAGAGGQELVSEARARQGHRGPLPSRLGAVWAGPSRPRAEKSSRGELMDGGGVGPPPGVLVSPLKGAPAGGISATKKEGLSPWELEAGRRRCSAWSHSLGAFDFEAGSDHLVTSYYLGCPPAKGHCFSYYQHISCSLFNSISNALSQCPGPPQMAAP